MEQFVADLNKKIAHVEEMYKTAQASAKTVRAGLTGRTGETFDTEHADWQRTGEEQLIDLRILRGRVANAARNYREAERANATMLDGLS